MNLFARDNLPLLLIAGASLGIGLYHVIGARGVPNEEDKKGELAEERKEVIHPDRFKKRTSVLLEERKAANENELLEVPHLSNWAEDEEVVYRSPLLFDKCDVKLTVESTPGFVSEESFVKEGTFVLGPKDYKSVMDIEKAPRYVRAGARKELFFNPKEARAAIVTCGGLCPGLNVVIRQIVMCLWYNYGCNSIYGIKYGYRGLYEDPEYWMELNPSIVSDIHHQGGTILGSSRGGYLGEDDISQKILAELERRDINLLYVIGGDGTHKGIESLYKFLRKRGSKIAVAGIPKTIDNDIPIIDKSFGFDTAVNEAVTSIDCANTEAIALQKGVGLVKLMGRHAGFIALYASLASRDVNFCLCPEFPVSLYGKNGFLERLCHRFAKGKNHSVVVVAEGMDESIRDLKLGSTGFDASKNKLHADLGPFLKGEITRYAKEQHKMDVSVKYIDPTYIIRAVPPIASDKILCTKLAQNVVHGTIAGYTGFTVGVVRGALVFIPVELLNETKVRRIQQNDPDFQRLLASTGQGQPDCYV